MYSQVFSVAVTCPLAPAVAMTAHVQKYQSISGSRVMKRKSAETATSAQWQVVAVVSTAPPLGAINTRKAFSTQEGAFHPWKTLWIQRRVDLHGKGEFQRHGWIPH